MSAIVLRQFKNVMQTGDAGYAKPTVASSIYIHLMSYGREAQTFF
jgi:hypothetical protein